jgi:hypothetical protein
MRAMNVIGILVVIVLAALVYWICLALGLPAIVCIIAALAVLLVGFLQGSRSF